MLTNKYDVNHSIYEHKHKLLEELFKLTFKQEPLYLFTYVWLSIE